MADIECSDVIHREHVGESLRLYHNPAHRWYFLSQQMPEEVVIFRNTASLGFHVPCECKTLP